MLAMNCGTTEAHQREAGQILGEFGLVTKHPSAGVERQQVNHSTIHEGVGGIMHNAGKVTGILDGRDLEMHQTSVTYAQRDGRTETQLFANTLFQPQIVQLGKFGVGLLGPMGLHGRLELVGGVGTLGHSLTGIHAGQIGAHEDIEIRGLDGHWASFFNERSIAYGRMKASHKY